MEIQMEDQGKFLEMLQGIKEIAASQQNRLTQEEIKKYLGEESLSEEKMKAVYQYLGESGITVEGYRFIPVQAVSEEENENQEDSGETSVTERKDNSENKEKTSDDSVSRSEANMQIYREELHQVSGQKEEDEENILAFLQGDQSKRDTVIYMGLNRVIELAGKYEKRSVPMDEMIAEGNVGLMFAMKIIEENREEYITSDGSLDNEKFFGTLDMEVTRAIEEWIDEETNNQDWENAVLAKINLLHEATKHLTEELGKVPTMKELAEYTRISEEEIENIRSLSEDAKRVAEQDETEETGGRRRSHNLNLRK